jgi:uncharacterized membrane protein
MRDKDIVALITIIFLILYFYPFSIIKFISLSMLLFFSPGFFLLKLLYRDMKLEELILLSFGVSIAISGGIALLLAALGILSALGMLVSLSLIVVAGYFLSSSIDIKLKKFTKPDKFVVVMVSLMLILMGIWLYAEFSTKKYKEIDIGITSWPQNSTINDTLHFTIYLKNWNYGRANCTVIFHLNNKNIEKKSALLNDGDRTYLYFQATSNKTGMNLASFDLFVNGKYYTNVHVYFELKD